jgi:hypothetical protein
MSFISLTVPTPVAAPRGAAWAAALFSVVLQRLSPALRATAEVRARVQRGRDAAALRRYAAEVGRTDPAFAADLYAAADRHMEVG